MLFADWLQNGFRVARLAMLDLYDRMLKFNRSIEEQ
jgi:hypothetical protein